MRVNASMTVVTRSGSSGSAARPATRGQKPRQLLRNARDILHSAAATEYFPLTLTLSLREYVFCVVGISRCDVRAACSGATPSNAVFAWTFIPPATTRAETARRAIPTIVLSTYLREPRERGQRASDGCLANNCWANSGTVVIERWWTILPLPKGEGRGEGEPCVAIRRSNL